MGQQNSNMGMRLPAVDSRTETGLYACQPQSPTINDRRTGVRFKQVRNKTVASKYGPFQPDPAGMKPVKLFVIPGHAARRWLYFRVAPVGRVSQAIVKLREILERRLDVKLDRPFRHATKLRRFASIIITGWHFRPF